MLCSELYIYYFISSSKPSHKANIVIFSWFNQCNIYKQNQFEAERLVFKTGLSYSYKVYSPRNYYYLTLALFSPLWNLTETGVAMVYHSKAALGWLESFCAYKDLSTTMAKGTFDVNVMEVWYLHEVAASLVEVNNIPCRSLLWLVLTQIHH